MSYRLAPLQLFWAYTAFVFACLFVGPLGYRNLNIWLLIGFVGPFVLLLSLGYRLGVGPRWSEPGLSVHRAGVDRAPLTLLLWPLVLWSVGSSIYDWVTPSLSGQSVSLSTIGESYVEGYRGYERGSATINAAYLLTIVNQTIVTLTIVIGLSSLGRVKRGLRYAILFVLGSYVLTNLLYSGKQKYLGDAVVFIGAILLVALAVRRTRIRLWMIASGGVALILILGVFAEIIRQRYSASGIDPVNVMEKVHPLMTWDTNSVLFQVLGPKIGFAAGFFVSYFSNGLYGLSLSLSLPFDWSYGVGNSYSLGRIVEIAVDAPGAVLEHTYPYRVGEVYGWGFSKWHSAFAWIASDISFPGILALSPLAGFVYGRVWRQSVEGENPFAAPLFCYLSLGMIFVYANNQMVHTLAGVFVLAFLGIAWTIRQLSDRRWVTHS